MRANDLREDWLLSLPAAIRAALLESEIVRVVYQVPAAFVDVAPRPDLSPLVEPYYELPVGNCFGPPIKTAQVAGPIMISRLNATTSPWRFRVEVTELVRSVEQRYWFFAYQHARTGLAESLVRTSENMMKRELTKAPAYRRLIAEAEQYLRRFRDDLALQTRLTKVSELRLRSVMGLPEFFDCHLVPTTRPLEDRVSDDLGECLREMLQIHPDLMQVKLDTRIDAASSVAPHPIAHNEAKPATSATQSQAAAVDRTAQQNEMRNAIDTATQKLRQSLRDLDASFDQYQMSKQHRATASARLQDRERAYEEGRITIVEYFIASSDYATAAASEAQTLSAYNMSLTLLAVARGTLLAERLIIVLDNRPRQPKNWINGETKMINR